MRALQACGDACVDVRTSDLLLDWFASANCSDTFFDQAQTASISGSKVWTTSPGQARSRPAPTAPV
jgi:hypothetical protein